jgi:hypothetical protein
VLLAGIQDLVCILDPRPAQKQAFGDDNLKPIAAKTLAETYEIASNENIRIEVLFERV